MITERINEEKQLINKRTTLQWTANMKWTKWWNRICQVGFPIRINSVARNYAELREIERNYTEFRRVVQNGAVFKGLQLR